MPYSPPILRHGFVEIVPDETRIRCPYQRQGKVILRYTVQMKIIYSGKWQAVVRYDNAHGFCHRDTIHADGIQEKRLCSLATSTKVLRWLLLKKYGPIGPPIEPGF